MRQLTDHIVENDSVNHQLQIEVMDEPGAGGANHRYEIRKPHGEGANFPLLCAVHFQNGPIREAGINGVTHEALLAIVIDRLRSFQAGPYANEHNAAALTDLEHALLMLRVRTMERIARNVEGTHQR